MINIKKNVFEAISGKIYNRGFSIALELRKMPEQLRVSAKSEIYQVIFKHQMIRFNNNANNAQVYQPKINYD